MQINIAEVGRRKTMAEIIAEQDAQILVLIDEVTGLRKQLQEVNGGNENHNGQ